MLNKFVWETYLKGDGNNTVAFFENSYSNGFSGDYANEICKFHNVYCPSKTLNQSLHDELCFEEYYPGFDYALKDNKDYSVFSALEEIYNDLINENVSPEEIFINFSDSIAYYSTYLFDQISELFFPYYFKCNFNVVEKIAQEFDIAIPEMPIKKDYKGRFFYYGKLCESLYKFRIQHNMSQYELCAFLYDFAPKYICGTESYIIKELPEPKSAYFIGATKDDWFLSDDTDIITPWQCNPDTLAGDMIVMYLKSPISAIDSIWQSVSVGFNDPFFYYYRCTYIAKPQKIDRISQKELQQDEIFKNLPIVRKNMQGINGVELYPSYYNRLIDMSKANLFKFKYVSDVDNTEYSIEKDVENKLIKPFIATLGYSEKDYLKQMYIEIGNHNHALIPDFAINPTVSKGHYSADFIIEAKLTIPTQKFLEETKTQARSYANMLKVKYAVIASKEGIWIVSSADDFSEEILSFSWQQLNSEDNFYKVLSVLGNGKLKR